MRQPINNVEDGRSPADNRCPRRAAGQEGSAERKRGAPVCPAAWAFAPSGSARGLGGGGGGLAGMAYAQSGARRQGASEASAGGHIIEGALSLSSGGRAYSVRTRTADNSVLWGF